MADTKISALTDGSPLQSTDDIPVARGGANRRVRIDLSDYATAAQGTLADSAVQPATAATLTNKTINAFSNDVEADTIHEEVRNSSGAELTALTPVYASGYNVGQELVEVDACDADNAATMPCIGLVETSIDNNQSGAIVTVGRIENVATNTYSVGDVLYVDTTPGQLTATRPVGGLAQPVAIVVRSHSSAGVVFVLAELLAGVLSLSGADNSIITGTAGTANRLAKWNSDGDLVNADGTTIILDGLPTSDPVVAGQLWVDGSNFLKVSSG